MNPATKPSGRWWGKMAYLADGKAVLFGGERTDYFNDTWVYNYSTNTWDNKQPAIAPSGRESHAMAYGGDGKAVLFGGDADFVPVINHLRNMAKEVMCVGRRQTTAIDLINASSDFKDLEEYRHIIEKPRRAADYRPYSERTPGGYQREHTSDHYRRSTSSPDGFSYGAKSPDTSETSRYEEKAPSYGDVPFHDEEAEETERDGEKEDEGRP